MRSVTRSVISERKMNGIVSGGGVRRKGGGDQRKHKCTCAQVLVKKKFLSTLVLGRSTRAGGIKMKHYPHSKSL
jgi:hypothetical protein